jgi:hypothetical protein
MEKKCRWILVLLMDFAIISLVSVPVFSLSFSASNHSAIDNFKFIPDA